MICRPALSAFAARRSLATATESSVQITANPVQNIENLLSNSVSHSLKESQNISVDVEEAALDVGVQPSDEQDTSYVGDHSMFVPH
jgi:hypothetical protein